MKLICLRILLLWVCINLCNGFSLSKVDDKLLDKRQKRAYYRLNDILLVTPDDNSEYLFSYPPGTVIYPKNQDNSYDINLSETNEWTINTDPVLNNNKLYVDDSIILEYEPESDNDESDKTLTYIESPKCPTIIKNNKQKEQHEAVTYINKWSSAKNDTKHIKNPKDINISIKVDHNHTINNKTDIKYVSSNQNPIDDKRDEIQNSNIWNIIYFLLDMFNKTNIVKHETTSPNLDTQTDPNKQSFYQNLQGLFTSIIKDNVFINNAFSNSFVLPNKESLDETNNEKNTYKPKPEIVLNNHKTITSNPKTTEIDIGKTTATYIIDDRLSVESEHSIKTTTKPDKLTVVIILNEDKDTAKSPNESTTNKTSDKNDIFNKTNENNLGEIVSSTEKPFSKDKNKVEKEKELTDIKEITQDSILDRILELLNNEKILDFLDSLANKYLDSLISHTTNITEKLIDILNEIVLNKDKSVTTSPKESTTSELLEIDDLNNVTDHESNEIINSTEDPINKNKNEIEKEKEPTASHQSASKNILDHIIAYLGNDKLWEFLVTNFNLANKYLESLISLFNKNKKEPVENLIESLRCLQDKHITTSTTESNINELSNGGEFIKLNNNYTFANCTEESFSKDKNEVGNEKDNFWELLEGLANKYLELLISESTANHEYEKILDHILGFISNKKFWQLLESLPNKYLETMMSINTEPVLNNNELYDTKHIKNPKDINISIKVDHNHTVNNKTEVKYVSSNQNPINDKHDEIQNSNIWNIIYFLLDMLNKTNIVKHETTSPNLDTQTDPNKQSFYQNLQGLFTSIIKDNVFINNAFSNSFVLPNKESLDETNNEKNTYKPKPEIVLNNHKTITSTPKTTEIDIGKTTATYIIDDRLSVESEHSIKTTTKPDKLTAVIILNEDKDTAKSLNESTTNKASDKNDIFNQINENNLGEIVSSTEKPFSKDKNKVEKEKEPTDIKEITQDSILDRILELLNEAYKIKGS